MRAVERSAPTANLAPAQAHPPFCTEFRRVPSPGNRLLLPFPGLLDNLGVLSRFLTLLEGKETMFHGRSWSLSPCRSAGGNL